MSVKERYGTMMDNAFGGYYDLFRKQKALSSDMAVTMEKLFDGTKPTAADRQMIRKSRQCTASEASYYSGSSDSGSGLLLVHG